MSPFSRPEVPKGPNPKPCWTNPMWVLGPFLFPRGSKKANTWAFKTPLFGRLTTAEFGVKDLWFKCNYVLKG